MHFETTFFFTTFSFLSPQLNHRLFHKQCRIIFKFFFFFSSLGIINQLIPPLYSGCGLPPNESANEIRGAVDPSAGPDSPGPQKNGPPVAPFSLQITKRLLDYLGVKAQVWRKMLGFRLILISPISDGSCKKNKKFFFFFLLCLYE